MFEAILIGIFLVVFIGAVIAAIILPRVNDDGYHPKRIAIITAVSALVLGLALTFFSTAKIIGPTEVGVPVSFGTVGQPMSPGLNFVAPWVDIDTYPTRPITVELSGDQKIIARTADAGQMNVEVAVRWRVLPEDARELYLQARTGDDDFISENIVAKNLRQAVGEVYSVTGNLDSLKDRSQIVQAIHDKLVTQLQPYGITLGGVDENGNPDIGVMIRSVEPDEKTASTIALYSSQQQATRIAEEAKKTATIEAQRRLIEAQGLEQSANAVTNISPDSAKILCMQIWQQVQLKAIDAGTPLYTNPCGTGTNVGVIAGTTTK